MSLKEPKAEKDYGILVFHKDPAPISRSKPGPSLLNKKLEKGIQVQAKNSENKGVAMSKVASEPEKFKHESGDAAN